MADGYSALAPVYDRLNDTVDYAASAGAVVTPSAQAPQ